MSVKAGSKTVYWVVLAATLLLASGVINYLVEGVRIPVSVPIVRSLRYQTLTETVSYIVTLALGVMGVEIILRGISGIRKSYGRVVAGLSLFLLSVGLTVLLWMAKTGSL